MIAAPESNIALAFATPYHAPVLVDAVLRACASAATVLDGTLGGGGHTAALLAAGKRVTSLDRDPAAVAVASERLADDLARGALEIVECNFADVSTVPALTGRSFDAILLDLGVSSRQLDDDTRGFSFRVGAPLDMRMEARGPSAADWLNTESEDVLVQSFREYGDEPRANRLARQVVERRAVRPFSVSDDFVNAIRATLGARSGPSDFARLFQRQFHFRKQHRPQCLLRNFEHMREQIFFGDLAGRAVDAIHAGTSLRSIHQQQQAAAFVLSQFDCLV